MEDRGKGMEQELSRDATLDTLKRHKREIFRKFPVRRIALFGSLARGEQRIGSDIDILVDVDPSIGLRFVALADTLQDLLKCKVDLVSVRGIKPSLLSRIERESIDV